jgi:hypothetical protein
MTDISSDPSQIQPFTDFLDAMIRDVLNNGDNMIEFGDLYPTLARIVLWCNWKNKTVISKATLEPAIYTVKSKTELMTKVLDKMIACYAEHAYALQAVGVTLYAATVEPHTSQLRMEFIFNPAHIADAFFKRLTHDRTLARLHHEDMRADWPRRNPEPEGPENVPTEEVLNKLRKSVIKRAGQP